MAVHFLRHVIACNRWDPSDFSPFNVAGRQVGRIRRAHVDRLAGLGEFLVRDGDGLALDPRCTDRTSRTAALDALGARLVADGIVPKLRGERYAVSAGWGEEVLAEIDRGIVPVFGTRSYGVHVNGVIEESDPDDPMLWIGRRAADKEVAPDKLDNMIAGGLPAGFTPAENLAKEAAEEADLPADLAAKARPVGAIRYRMAVPQGLRDDVLFVYDLRVPASFTPRNTDGEIARFERMASSEALRRVAASDDFKFNVALVLIDFAIRHGLITPEHPEYLALALGLSGRPATR